MSKKEINIFSISFLDLLSGALGAVIILYIIIPKSRSEGFKYKGHNILFIVDCSGSMVTNNCNNEDRLSSVKAGVKMLIATTTEIDNIDVISFQGNNNHIKAKFQMLKPANQSIKLELYDFLYHLEAGGATPTKSVLEYAFENYNNLSDIVFLSDGDPSDGEMDEIVILVGNYNSQRENKVQINCIGVGCDFFNDPNSIKVQLLRKLARENENGFFISF